MSHKLELVSNELQKQIEEVCRVCALDLEEYVRIGSLANIKVSLDVHNNKSLPGPPLGVKISISRYKQETWFGDGDASILRFYEPVKGPKDE